MNIPYDKILGRCQVWKIYQCDWDLSCLDVNDVFHQNDWVLGTGALDGISTSCKQPHAQTEIRFVTWPGNSCISRDFSNWQHVPLHFASFNILRCLGENKLWVMCFFVRPNEGRVWISSPLIDDEHLRQVELHCIKLFPCWRWDKDINTLRFKHVSHWQTHTPTHIDSIKLVFHITGARLRLSVTAPTMKLLCIFVYMFTFASALRFTHLVSSWITRKTRCEDFPEHRREGSVWFSSAGAMQRFYGEKTSIKHHDMFVLSRAEPRQ